MLNNTPTLTQSEEKRAPWNEKTKIINVDVSQCLSCSVNIEVPEDLEYDPKVLEEYVREQIQLPSEIVNKYSDTTWYVDDFCVV